MYEKYCLQCGKLLDMYWSNGKYCSIECGKLYRGDIKRLNKTVICPICKKEFISHRKDSRYCSGKCRQQQYIIDKGLNKQQVEWLELREFIIERDNYTCNKCGLFSMTTVGLQVHHIKPLSRGGTNNIDNLITLCHKCHSHSHNIPETIDTNLLIRV